VESHFEVRTDVPVGDLPRQADIVLVHRTRAGPLPFSGLWHELTPWNVFEFKGPSVSARDEHLDALVEVGLGIHRRLNEERDKQGQPLLGPEAVSFWYLANRLGRRLLRGWQARRAPELDRHGQGVWRCVVLGRLVFLVSGADLPVEESSLPLHVIGREPPETELAVARFVAGRPDLWERYAGWLAGLHTAAYKEVESMAKTRKGKFEFNMEPIIQDMGWEWVIEKLGPKRVAEYLGARGYLKEVGMDAFLAQLTPEERRELKRRLQ
jgi:hypothetical protein